MSPDDGALLDVDRFARQALAFTEGMDLEQFEADRRTQQATLHSLTLMGEAVKRLTPEFRSEHPDVNRGDIAGLRDVPVHSYHRVDLGEVWVIVKDYLPGLLSFLAPLVPPASPS